MCFMFIKHCKYKNKTLLNEGKKKKRKLPLTCYVNSDIL